jgi:hypothetical protein
VARCFVIPRGSYFHILTLVLPSSNDRGSYTPVARNAMHQSSARPYITAEEGGRGGSLSISGQGIKYLGDRA